MNDYVIVKWLHILASTFLFGTGVGSAFYLLMAAWRGRPPVVHFVVRQVVLADWLFTATTVILQPLTGWYLMHRAGFPLTATWLHASVVLYVLAVGCWLPVVWLQIRMRRLSAPAAQVDGELPPAFWRAFRAWVGLGVPALFAFLAIFYLMVAKPA